MVHVCPTEFVRASAQQVWRTILAPRELARWTDTRLIEAPNRELREGDRLVLGAGLGHRIRVTLEVRKIVAGKECAVHVHLPFGVTNKEVIRVTRVVPDACRVAFSWTFEFPPGWRGWLIRTLLGRRFVNGPADALRRLKEVAEHP